MKLNQALKVKNRLAGDLVRQQQILQRENARRSDSVSKVDRSKVWENILAISDKLGELKARIATANVGIYPKLERMAELKARIAYITGLHKRDGEEITFEGLQREKVTYTWTSEINQEKADALVAQLQEQIAQLQDEVDEYNATYEIG